MRSALVARSHARTAVGSLWKREGEWMYVRNERGERQKGVLVTTIHRKLEHYRQQAQKENRGGGGGTMRGHSLLSVVDFPKTRKHDVRIVPGQEEARNVPLSL